jgi:CRISPR-associated exonuclease Cas4
MLDIQAASELTVTDLKQWAYCPRIPFYRYVLPVERPVTYKMERGKVVQAAVEALERRRGFRAYSMKEGERQFGIWLRSTRLGLSGKLDLLIRTPEACYPVDFKDTEGRLRQNHRVQLAAYALLAEETFGKPVPQGFVYLVPRKEVVAVPIEEADRNQVVRMLEEIRQMIALERMPEPTPVRIRCETCEYQNYCADIW